MSDDNNNGLCCCCIGVAIGYMLFAPNACGEGSHRHSQNNTSLTDVVRNEASAESTEANAAKPFLIKQIEKYQQNISPKIRADFGDVCRYTPSCSEYAKQAIEKHGNVKGTAMAAARLVRCNPLSDGGYDPVA